MSPRRPDPPFRLEVQSQGYFGPNPGDWSPPLPAGVFLDSSIVVYLEKYGEQIWDNTDADPALPEQQSRQIEALPILMALAGRAGSRSQYLQRSPDRPAAVTWAISLLIGRKRGWRGELRNEAWRR